MGTRRTAEHAVESSAPPVASHRSSPMLVARPAGNQELQRRARDGQVAPTADASGGPAPQGMDHALQGLGGGTPLPHHARRSLEEGLGVPLDDVRLHTGRAEGAFAEQMGAEAFTVGQDVVLGRGATDTDSPSGFHLFAHEVAHTLQPGVSGGASLSVGAVDTPEEREAESIANELTTRRFGATEATSPVGRPGLTTGPTGAGAGRTIRRFGRLEHQVLGDATGETIDLGGGMVLSWGQVVSLAGDEFGSVNDLREMATKHPAQLRAILASDSVHSPEYVQLAMTNVSHFAGGGTATSTWEGHHTEALRAAVMAGVHDSYAEYQDAMLIEAFGEHFLTDSFSTGHIRTPREAIIAWYQGDFAPRALPAFIAAARARLREGIARQLDSQMTMPKAVIERMVDAAMGGALAYFADEIRDHFQPMFGLGFAGAVSGVLHDRDNERGLWVSSDAHPDPWLAYGDDRLVCSPTSAEQAKAAVMAGRDELVAARKLGDDRREATAPRPIPMTPYAAPCVVHFGFDSSTVDGATALALDEVSDFLVARPELVVDITGHTDPLGTDDYNDGLGMRRAEAVAGYLMSKGIAPIRLRSASAGEHQLISAAPSGYASDRRAELAYRADSAAPDDLDWAQQVLSQRFPGPPYPTIERFQPRAVPGLNDPQEDWRWGTMTSEMASELDGWISHYVGPYRGQVVTDGRLDPQQVPVPDVGLAGPLLVPPIPITVTLVTIEPRTLVLSLLDDLIARPTPFIGDLVGIAAANRSVPPLPPPVSCP